MLDDNSKKFIKETIEDAIDKKLDDREKKTQASKRLDDLKYEKRSLEDRKKLLAELQTRDKKGENTIAQKFEMMKLAVDNVIPQDIKDAYKSSTKTIGNGASQIGQGISHLTERAMLSNPITAFLYNNRDILGAVGDIGIGTAKMGWGALKGIGHGALGLANSAVNLFKPKQEEEDTEEETEKLNIKPPIFNGNDNNGGITKIAKQKADWQVKIDKIHEVVTKLKDGNTKSSSLLAKGLKGINDSMNAVKGFVDTIVAKQKLILGGVMLGAVAILGLAMWFQNGGLKNLINNLNPNGDKNNENFEALHNTVVTTGMEGKDLAPILRKQAANLGGLDPTKTTTISNENLSKLTSGKVKATDKRDGKIFNTGGKLTPVLAPFKGIVRSVNPYTEGTGDDKTVKYEMVIQPDNQEVANKTKSMWKSANSSQLVFRNLIEPQVQTDDPFEKNDILAFVRGQLIAYNEKNKGSGMELFMKDYESQINTSKAQNYNPSIDRLEKTKSKEKTEALTKFYVDKQRASNYRQNEGWGADLVDRVFYNINAMGYKDDVKNTVFKPEEDKEKIIDAKINNTQNPSVSVNQQKAKDQNEQLNKPQEKTDKTSNNISTNPVEQPKTNLVATLPSQNIPYDFADLRSTGDINLMTSNGTTNTGVIVT